MSGWRNEPSRAQRTSLSARVPRPGARRLAPLVAVVAGVTSAMLSAPPARAEPLVEAAQDPIEIRSANVYVQPRAFTLLYRGGPEESWALAGSAGDACTHPPVEPLFDGKSFTTPTCGDDPAVTAPVAPVAGVDAVAVAVPNWCGGYRRSAWSLDHQLHVQAGFSQPFTRWPETLPLAGPANPYGALDELRAIGVAACDRRRYAPRQRRVANWLQQWANTYRVSAAELGLLLPALVARPDFGSKDFCRSQDPEASRLLCRALRFDKKRPDGGPQPYPAYGNGYAPWNKRDIDIDLVDSLEPDAIPRFLDWHERQGAPKATVHLAAILKMAAGVTKHPRLRPIVGSELERFDWARFSQLFDADPLERWVSNQAIGQLKQRLTDAAAGADNARWLDARREYDAIAKTHAQLFTEVHALADALIADALKWPGVAVGHSDERRAKLVSECATSVDPWLGRLRAGRKLDSAAGLSEFWRDPAVELVAYVARLCPTSELAWLGSSDSAVVAPRLWGPRKYFFTEPSEKSSPIAKALRELLTPEDSNALASTGTSPSGSCARTTRAIQPCEPSYRDVLDSRYVELRVAKATVTDAGLRVEWAPFVWHEEDFDCNETNKIDRIDQYGRVVYRSNCHVIGSKAQKQTFEPSLLPAELAGALKPGMVARIARNTVGGYAFLLALFADLKSASNGTKPIALLGERVGR